MVRKCLPLYSNGLWRNHPSGLARGEPLRADAVRFLLTLTCGLHLFFIACMRFRRGRPDFSGLSIAGYFPGRTVAAGGPLRAEGCPKRRCQFESVAAQPHLSPRKGLKF